MVLKPGTYKMRGKRYAADYGMLKVPENYGRGNGTTLDIPLIRIKAVRAAGKSPVFMLHGGPGIKNVANSIPQFLISERDVVMVGYRGVEGSVVLDCPTFKKAINAIDGTISPRYLGLLAAAFDRDTAALEAGGIDPSQYTMLEVIEDMESARTALGYEKIDLWSESYGTRVAYLYSQIHPARLERSVMIGVNPPGHFAWRPEMTDSQLQYYNTLWRHNPERAERCGDLPDAIRDAFRNMPPRWLFIPLNPAKIKIISFVMLFHKNTAGMVFDSFISARDGDYSGLALMSAAYGLIVPRMIAWGDLIFKGGSADGDESLDYETLMDPPGSFIGSPLSKILLGFNKYAKRKLIMIPEKYRRLNDAGTETLMINGSVDFSTPAEGAAHELLPRLKRGRLVVLKEFGHVMDITSLQPKALERLVTTFYDSGRADDSLYRYDAADFKTAVSPGTLAKILVAAIPLSIIAVMMIVSFIIKRLI